MNKKQKGNLSEFLARLLLRLKGFRIVENNYITGRGSGCGELDIVAVKNRTIIFVEVKERQTLENAFYAIRPTQQKRIVRAAKLYLARHPEFASFDVRFDAVFVSGLKVKHITNAWLSK